MIPFISIILSIGLPIIAVCIGAKRGSLKRPYLFSVGSFVCCGAGIIAELITVKNRVLAGDIGGIEDTITAVIILCSVLLAITAVLNLLLLWSTNEGRE